MDRGFPRKSRCVGVRRGVAESGCAWGGGVPVESVPAVTPRDETQTNHTLAGLSPSAAAAWEELTPKTRVLETSGGWGMASRVPVHRRVTWH